MIRKFTIAKNRKYDGYQFRIGWIVGNIFDKKSALIGDKSASGGSVRNENMSNQHHLDN